MPSIPLASSDRLTMMILFSVQIILFIYFNLLITHYTFLPMPFLTSAPSLLSGTLTKASYLYNGILYSLFFLQHVGMALLKFKVSLHKNWPKYPLYERYIYNISASLTYIWIIYSAKPAKIDGNQLFTTPFYLNAILLTGASVTLLISVIKLGGDILSPFSLSRIMQGKEIQFSGYENEQNAELVCSGIYGFCRHPMQASVIVLLMTASNTYTMDRLIFNAVNIAGILVGVHYEQKRLEKRIKKYSEYKRKVQYKFFPFIL